MLNSDFESEINMHGHNETEVEQFKHKNDELKAKLDYFKDLYDRAPVGYVTLNHKGQILQVNDYAAKILKKEKKALLDRHFELFIDDNCRACLQQILINTAGCDDSQQCTLQLSQRIANEAYIRVSCINHQKTPDKIYLTFTDVTNQKIIEDELRIAAVAFETQEAIAITDAYRSIIKVNQAFRRLTGYDIEDAIDLTPAFLRSGLQSNEFYDEMWGTVSATGYWQGEHWEKRKNGEIYPALVTLSAVYDDTGRITHFIRFSRDISVEIQAQKILLESKQDLENQVITTKSELEKVKKETEEINTALNILLRRRESEKNEAQLTLLNEIESFIKPFLNKLKQANSGRKQSSRLLGVIENNLAQLVKAYGVTETLPATLLPLTPVEKQIASMVRQGLSTKAIAKTLNSTAGTVSIHRKNIRKKLGLSNKGVNLQNYLMTLSE
jgi:PAS domain S-box-containing protein